MIEGTLTEVALRHWLVEIIGGTQEGGKPSLLVPVPPGHGNMLLPRPGVII